jgi:hypothetical protein
MPLPDLFNFTAGTNLPFNRILDEIKDNPGVVENLVPAWYKKKQLESMQ